MTLTSLFFDRLGAPLLSLIVGSLCLHAQSVTYPASDYTESSPGKRGGTLHASAGYEPGSLDIHQRYEGNLLWEGRLLFDSLVYLDAKGEPSPWIAKAWKISPDGCTYTFTLREDVTFSDGTPCDAEAVLVNFDRIKHLAGKSRISAAYLEPYRDGIVRDRFTFEAHLDSPYPAFLSFLAQTWMGLISPRQIREAPETISEHAIGSGPFILTEYSPGKRAVFKRREDYTWSPRQLSHQGAAYLDEIVLEGVREEPARKARLLSARDEICLEPPLGSIRELRETSRFTVSNRIRAGSPMRSLAFNPRHFPFDDVRIRRAVALALNRAAQTRLIAGGEFLPTSAYLGATTPDYDSAFKDVLAYNPEEANALLDGAGFTVRDQDGYRTKAGHRLEAELLTTGTERTPSATVLAMQSDLKNIGFDLHITLASSADLISRVREARYDALTGGWWSAATPDVLFLLYHSSQVPRQHIFGQDTASLADPNLDDVLFSARRELDPAKRRALYIQAQRLLTELIPVVPLHESHQIIAYSSKVRGLVFDTVHNTPLFTTAWIDE